MKIKLYTFLLLLVAISGCKKYLDEKSDTSLVIPKSITDLQRMLNDFYIMNSQTPAFGEVSSDDYFLLESSYNSFSKFDRDAYTWQLDTYTYGGDWDGSYSAIYVTNYCLEQIDKIERNAQNEINWNNVKGAAYFFRAFHFLNLAWVFAKSYDEETANSDLGIVLRLGSDFNVKSTRASVKETYNQIISDAKEASRFLPDHPVSHVAQPSKAASYALLARAYLSMREYDSAYKYSNLSLSIKNSLLDYNSPEVSPNNFVPFQPLNSEIIFLSFQAGYFTAKHPVYARIDTSLYSSYDADDKRKVVFFADMGDDLHRFQGSYAANFFTLFSGLAVDEVLLIRAESNARMGNVPEAMNDLNALLVKRWTTGTFNPYTASTQEEAISLILNERRKELLMRGIRWSDIKRLNKEGANIIPQRVVGTTVYKLEPNSNKYARPLPSDIIDITGMAQNPQ